MLDPSLPPYTTMRTPRPPTASGNATAVCPCRAGGSPPLSVTFDQTAASCCTSATCSELSAPYGLAAPPPIDSATSPKPIPVLAMPPIYRLTFPPKTTIRPPQAAAEWLARLGGTVPFCSSLDLRNSGFRVLVPGSGVKRGSRLFALLKLFGHAGLLRVREFWTLNQVGTASSSAQALNLSPEEAWAQAESRP
jgi:hypothetical protein